MYFSLRQQYLEKKLIFRRMLMKAFFVLVLIPLCFITSLITAPRKMPNHNQTPVFVPMPIPMLQNNNSTDEDKRDQEIFGHFLNILAGFGKILLNPEDLTQAKQNAGQIIDGIVNIANTIMKRSHSVRTKIAVLKLLEELSRFQYKPA